MQIPLSDTIWSRLYGPYGVQEVASVLERLSQRWDSALADDLFWEKLHHQDDLYPVTFAALPWLWEARPKSGPPKLDALFFFSHVVDCAIRSGGTGCDGTGPRGRFRGLSSVLQDHRHSWIPSDQWLNEDDMTLLAALEEWFSLSSGKIALTCIEAVPAKDNWLAAALSTGFATLNGGHSTATAMKLWADGHELEAILDHIDPDLEDWNAAVKIGDQISDLNKALAEFLVQYLDALAGSDD